MHVPRASRAQIPLLLAAGAPIYCAARNDEFAIAKRSVSAMANLLLNAALNLTNRFVEWRRRERAYAELSVLDDRSLADIGISRAEIPFVVAGRVPAEAQSFPTGAVANGNRRAAA